MRTTPAPPPPSFFEKQNHGMAGNEEDVRGLIAMLEEGAALLLAEGDEGTLGVYRDHLRG